MTNFAGTAYVGWFALTKIEVDVPKSVTPIFVASNTIMAKWMDIYKLYSPEVLFNYPSFT